MDFETIKMYLQMDWHDTPLLVRALALAIMLWAIMVFVAVIHEGGHALAGKSRGLRLLGMHIPKFGPGGYCVFDKGGDFASIWASPQTRLLVATSGPLANLVAGMLAGIALYTMNVYSPEMYQSFFGDSLLAFAGLNVVAAVGSMLPSPEENADSKVALAAARELFAARGHR